MHGDLRNLLTLALSAEEYRAAADLAAALLQAGDAGDPPGIHDYQLGISLLQLDNPIEAVAALKEAGHALPCTRIERARSWAIVAEQGARLGLGATLQEGAQHVLDECGTEVGGEMRLHVATAHQALGQFYGWCRQHGAGAHYHARAAVLYPDPWRRLSATCDWARELALAGDLVAAEQVLGRVDRALLPYYRAGAMAHVGAQVVVDYLCGRSEVAVEASERVLTLRVNAGDDLQSQLLTWMEELAALRREIEPPSSWSLAHGWILV